jgi:RHS repeat-associated protein
VLTVVSDKKIGVYSGGIGSLIDYYKPHILSAQDYYPFGMVSRAALNPTGQNYRYGFNGKENDSDVKGYGNQQDYGMRIYDPRLGRFLSVDPLQKKYPDLSPYQFTNNSPIAFTDPDGLERIFYKLTYDQKNGGRPVLTYTGRSDRSPTLGEAFLTIFKHNTKSIGEMFKKQIYVSLPSGGSKHFDYYKQFWDWQKTLTPQSEAQQEQAKAEYQKTQEQVQAATQLLINEQYMRFEMSDGKFDFDAPPDITGIGKSKTSATSKANERVKAANNGVNNPEYHGMEFLDDGMRMVEQPFGSVRISLKPSVSSVMGSGYVAKGEVTATIKNVDVLKALNSTSKGDWVKVYEAGILNGNKIETHYFRNNTTKEVFDVKIKYPEWHQKQFKKIND